MNIKKVGVLGCGLMGSGIAQVSAAAGYDVTVLEQEQKFLDKGFAGIEKSLSKFAEKGTLKWLDALGPLFYTLVFAAVWWLNEVHTVRKLQRKRTKLMAGGEEPETSC